MMKNTSASEATVQEQFAHKFRQKGTLELWRVLFLLKLLTF